MVYLKVLPLLANRVDRVTEILYRLRAQMARRPRRVTAVQRSLSVIPIRLVSPTIGPQFLPRVQVLCRSRAAPLAPLPRRVGWKPAGEGGLTRCRAHRYIVPPMALRKQAGVMK